MTQPLFAVLIIFVLFALCLCFSLAINLIRYKITPKKTEKKQTGETKIYYIDNYRKPKKSKKKPVTIPLKATVLKPEEFKKMIDSDNNG